MTYFWDNIYYYMTYFFMTISFISLLFFIYCILMMALLIGRRDIMEISKTGKLGKKPWWSIW